MTLCASIRSTGRRGLARLLAALVACVACTLAVAWPALAVAQGPASVGKPAVKAVATERGAHWSELKPVQRAALKPLEREWAGIDARSKQKWLEISAKFPKMTPPEQVRVQERMAAWAKLTPHERGEARMNFQEAKQVPALDRQARWKAYEALSPQQRQQLAARAAPAPDSAHKGAAAGTRNDRSGPQAKSNIVPNPAFSAQPKSVTPTVVQARPGATTTLITKRPMPPRHQQTGMPKIAATPEFVNEATLLPQRGPQGAATRSAAAPAADPAPARQ